MPTDDEERYRKIGAAACAALGEGEREFSRQAHLRRSYRS